MTPEQRIDEIKKRHEAATPGSLPSRYDSHADVQLLLDEIARKDAEIARCQSALRAIANEPNLNSLEIKQFAAKEAAYQTNGRG